MPKFYVRTQSQIASEHHIVSAPSAEMAVAAYWRYQLAMVTEAFGLLHTTQLWLTYSDYNVCLAIGINRHHWVSETGCEADEYPVSTDLAMELLTDEQQKLARHLLLVREFYDSAIDLSKAKGAA